ncbi:hypothetical protein PTKIN_Ptkin15bG0176900 [Pterospermum kingtungense]
MGDLKKTGLSLPVLLILSIMLVIPSSTSHSEIGSRESNSLSSFFNCNGSSADCFGRQGQDNLGLEFLMESETSQMVLGTRRILQQGGSPSSQSLNPANAACGRDKYGYLCTPPANTDVKRSENCQGSTFNRGCHQLQK